MILSFPNPWGNWLPSKSASDRVSAHTRAISSSFSLLSTHILASCARGRAAQSSPRRDSSSGPGPASSNGCALSLSVARFGATKYNKRRHPPGATRSWTEDPPRRLGTQVRETDAHERAHQVHERVRPVRLDVLGGRVLLAQVALVHSVLLDAAQRAHVAEPDEARADACERSGWVGGNKGEGERGE